MPVDLLKILRHDAGLGGAQEDGCPAMASAQEDGCPAMASAQEDGCPAIASAVTITES
ncbi:MAG: hypothetical protein IIC86_09375 [Chloroflexi bacterium]|nr:hypothetical protein [Chloroflexota bacterium]